jgi:carboxymethylenebutenolidase
MSRKDITIPTRDGDARASVITPDKGEGPWPAVIFFMDGPGIRPALFEMGQRLADHGYYVLLPDMFWRIPPYEPIDMKAMADDPKKRAEFFGVRMASTNPIRSTSDTAAFLDFLSKQPEVKGDKVGTTGYCMGGAMSLRAAGEFPGRVAAGAAVHGGGLATEADDSPHRLVPKIKAKVLVAAAKDDPYFPEEQIFRLDQAFKRAGTNAELATYPALHGFAPPDMPAYDREASERHWREMLALFDSALK